MQKNTPLIAAAIVLSAGTAGYWLYSQNDSSSQALTQQEQHLPADQYNQSPDATGAQMGDKEIAELNQLIDSFNDELAQTVDDEPLQDSEPLAITLWAPTDNLPSDGMLTLPEEVTDRTAINLDADELDVVATGDSVSFTLPGNHHYDAVIEKTTYNGNGDKTLTGYLAGTQSPDGGTYPVIITQGESTSFATITSPYGSYSMETINGQGWIYKNPPRSMLETAETDAIVPQESDHQH
ncbi:hypothetical protein [Kistimonas asteriae]|uniref:hypothetical protein n=1 Tax=Kistimonas asteriae TaxID=517724 RepID=UPI001BAD21F3|nr:hypothetical protein [Kistimonas asteriae]